MYAADMPSCGMIFLPSFMKTGKDVERILKFRFRNLKGCNVGITDGRDQQNEPLKLAQVA
jgi:hypothetical protein